MENNKITFEQLKERIIKIENFEEFNELVKKTKIGAFEEHRLYKFYTFICLVNEELLNHMILYSSKLDGKTIITVLFEESYNIIDFSDIFNTVKIISRGDYKSQPMHIDDFEYFVLKVDILKDDVFEDRVKLIKLPLAQEEVLNYCLMISSSVSLETREYIGNIFNKIFDRSATLYEIYDEYCNLNTRDMILINRLFNQEDIKLVASIGDVYEIKESINRSIHDSFESKDEDNSQLLN